VTREFKGFPVEDVALPGGLDQAAGGFGVDLEHQLVKRIVVLELVHHVLVFRTHRLERLHVEENVAAPVNQAAVFGMVEVPGDGVLGGLFVFGVAGQVGECNQKAEQVLLRGDIGRFPLGAVDIAPGHRLAAEGVKAIEEQRRAVVGVAVLVQDGVGVLRERAERLVHGGFLFCEPGCPYFAMQEPGLLVKRGQMVRSYSPNSFLSESGML